MEDESRSGVGFFGGLIVGILVIYFIWGIGKGGKYEGQTSEEWHDQYQRARSRARILENLSDCIASETSVFRELLPSAYPNHEAFENIMKAINEGELGCLHKYLK